ncbi:hypothetical protein Hanom_Chr12g01090401 [Helianthus anomalus]
MIDWEDFDVIEAYQIDCDGFDDNEYIFDRVGKMNHMKIRVKMLLEVNSTRRVDGRFCLIR